MHSTPNTPYIGKKTQQAGHDFIRLKLYFLYVKKILILKTYFWNFEHQRSGLQRKQSVGGIRRVLRISRHSNGVQTLFVPFQRERGCHIPEEFSCFGKVDAWIYVFIQRICWQISVWNQAKWSFNPKKAVVLYLYHPANFCWFVALNAAVFWNSAGDKYFPKFLPFPPHYI